MVTKQSGIASCNVCRTTFRYESKRIPATCGLLYCRAMDTWTAEEWAGQARMATVRQLCHLPLTQIDQEAIRRSHV
jgi:hypothetical protein